MARHSLGPQPENDCCLIRPAVAKIRLKGNLVHVSSQKASLKTVGATLYFVVKEWVLTTKSFDV